MRFRLPAVLLVASVTLLLATEPDAGTARWWSHIKALANDQMEGRDTGSAGYEKAEQYVIRQFQNAGLKPAGTNGFRQPVPLSFIKLNTQASSLYIERAGKASKLEWLKEVTLTSLQPNLPPSIQGQLYFTGDDSSLRPEDLAGKVVVLLSPPRFSSSPRTVKPQNLARAAAVFSIDTAGGRNPHGGPRLMPPLTIWQTSRRPIQAPAPFSFASTRKPLHSSSPVRAIRSQSFAAFAMQRNRYLISSFQASLRQLSKWKPDQSRPTTSSPPSRELMPPWATSMLPCRLTWTDMVAESLGTATPSTTAHSTMPLMLPR